MISDQSLWDYLYFEQWLVKSFLKTLLFLFLSLTHTHILAKCTTRHSTHSFSLFLSLYFKHTHTCSLSLSFTHTHYRRGKKTNWSWNIFFSARCHVRTGKGYEASFLPGNAMRIAIRSFYDITFSEKEIDRMKEVRIEKIDRLR